MSYYKVTYESNTVEGLTAIQRNVPGQKGSAADSAASASTIPPPPPQAELSSDGFSDNVQAPPLAVDGGTGMDANAFVSPPPNTAESVSADVGGNEQVPPPPNNMARDRENDGGESGNGFVPPPDSASPGPKSAKKGSK